MSQTEELREKADQLRATVPLLEEGATVLRAFNSSAKATTLEATAVILPGLATLYDAIADKLDSARLVWEENFNATTLDPTHWKYDHIRFNYGANSGQKLDNINLVRNVSVADGALIIRAVKEDFPAGDGTTAHWTAGSIQSLSPYDFRKGQAIEFHAQGDPRGGMRCAWWTSSPVAGDDGEFDVPEQIMMNGKLVWRLNTITDYSPVTQHQFDIQFPDDKPHIWRCEWHTDGTIEWFMDGVHRHTCPPSFGSQVKDNPHLVRIGFQVGGTWGQPIDSTVTTAQMRTDWVRVYELVN